MPKGSRSSQRSRSSQSLLLDVHRCTIDQLTRLPAEVLRLHLSSRHLVTSGNKSVMAQRLYHALRNADHSSSLVTTTPPPCATPTTVPLSLLPLRHLSPPHRHRQQHRANPLRRYPYHRQFPHLSTRPATDYVNVCSHVYYPASSHHFRSFMSARIAATADLSREPSNPTSYSGRSQPNSAHNTQSITCHYSGRAFYT